MPSDSSDFLNSEDGFPRPRHALRNLAMLSPLLVMIPGAVLIFMRHDREPDKEAEVRARTLQVAEAIWASENEEEQTVPPAELIPTNGPTRTPEITVAPPAVAEVPVETPKPEEPKPKVEAEKPVIVIGALPPKPAPQPTVKKPADQHLVRKGETLYSIGKLYGKTPDQLASYNRLQAKDAIREGQYLRLTPAASPKPAPLPAPVPVAPEKFMNLTPVSGQSADLPRSEDIKPLPMYCIEYLVQKNDTLESIAAAHATSAQTIIVLNGGPAVKAGQTIVVPVDEILGRVR